MFKRSVLILVGFVAFLNFVSAVDIDSVKEASKSLRSITCFVTATAYSRGRKSEIQYDFAFKRDGEKMKIEYLSPRNMKGTKIAIDGNYFYSYIANLHRTTKRKLKKHSSKNPGKDMGLFFYYMKGNFSQMIKGMNIKYLGSESVVLTGRNGKETVEGEHFSFEKGRDREELWFDTKTLVPVKIKRFVNNKPALEIDVTDIRVNPTLSDSVFVIE